MTILISAKPFLVFKAISLQSSVHAVDSTFQVRDCSWRSSECQRGRARPATLPDQDIGFDQQERSNRLVVTIHKQAAGNGKCLHVCYVLLVRGCTT